jgi:hypothetical protein
MSRFDNYKIHCSSIGAIMTEPQSKKDGLSETCKAHLLECWIKEMYGREKDISNKYLEKGLQAEEDSITLYSLVKGKFFKKNEEQISNDFLIGTYDLREPDTVIDIKTSWDIYTFYSVMHKPINKHYKSQLHGYGAILKVPKRRLVYTFVNTPEALIAKEKKRLMWDMGDIDPDTDPVYISGCEAIDKSSRYDDIPKEKRYIEFLFDEDPVAMAAIYTRVKECREFMNSLV